MLTQGAEARVTDMNPWLHDRYVAQPEQEYFTAPDGLVRSMAIRLLGNGVTTYMVLFTTSGPPSWPCGTPVETVVTTLRLDTLSGLS